MFAGIFLFFVTKKITTFLYMIMSSVKGKSKTKQETLGECAIAAA